MKVIRLRPHASYRQKAAVLICTRKIMRIQVGVIEPSFAEQWFWIVRRLDLKSKRS